LEERAALTLKEKIEPWRSQLKQQTDRVFRRFFPRDHSAILQKTATCPPLLSIETTNACNAKCVFCAYRYMQRPRIMMDPDIFKKAVDDYVECGGVNIGLSVTVGDPLLDPLLLERIAYGKSKGLRGFGFYTNGIALNRIDLRALLSSGLSAMHISISGFDRETYKRIYGTDAYFQVMENLCTLADLNNSMGKPVRLNVSVRSPAPIRQLVRTEDYRRLRALGLPIAFTIRYDNWSGKIKKTDLSGAMRMRPIPKKRQPCFMLWFGTTLHADGNLTLCGCRDLEADTELSLGNIRDRSIGELWRSPKVQRLRNSFAHRLPPICVDCAQYIPISDIGDWEISLVHALN
jgi:MoaA/NifB/PqqE/SkfB family radical SAM enzyme